MSHPWEIRVLRPGRMRESRLELLEDRAERFVELLLGAIADPGRHAAVVRLGDVAQGIRVDRERDGQGDGALVVGRVAD